MRKPKRGQRGRHTVPLNEQKRHNINVRLDDDQLSALETARGRMSRAELLRGALFNNLPRPIPSINLEMHQLLGRALGNLSSIAAASRRGGFVLETELLPLLHEVRHFLIAARSSLEDGGSE
jgi:hypothetical protein